MNIEMAYLVGMILGNGEIQRGNSKTRITIDIPHRVLRTDEINDVRVYVKASTVDIRAIVEPLIGSELMVTQLKSSTMLSFSLSNGNYILREIFRLIGGGTHHSTMRMNSSLFNITYDQKMSLLRGFADVTAYVRRSNIAYGIKGQHRVYIEIPGNWNMVIDIANLLKSVDIPIQCIDFAHPNCRDGNLTKYNQGNRDFWKKEHQIKIWANEFLAIGFNIQHKQEALVKYSQELLTQLTSSDTHKQYWEKPIRRRQKLRHPGESDRFLPAAIRRKHYNSWTDIAGDLGFGENS